MNATNATVERIVNLLFEDLQESEEVIALREEVMNNCQERYRDLREQGLTEDDAIGQVVESLKGMEEMLASYPKKKAEAGNPYGAETFAKDGADSIHRLRVELMDACIVVEPSPDSGIHCKMDGTGSPFIRVRQEGDCLVVTQSKDGGESSSAFSWLGRMIQSWTSGGCDIRLQLPEAASLSDVNIHTMSGDATWRKVPSGRLEIRTASGDAEVTGASGGEIRIHSASGDIDVSGDCGRLSMESMSGDIDWNGAAERVFCKTASGDVDLDGSFGEMEASSVSGDVDLNVRSAGTGRIQLKSVSGDVEITLPRGVRADAQISSVSGEARNDTDPGAEKTVRVQATTVSGDVTIS